MIAGAAVALGSPWLGRPIQQHHQRLGGGRGRSIRGAGRLRSSIASLDLNFMDSSVGNAVRDGVLSFHKMAFQGSMETFPSSEPSLGWWAVAAPAALWFLLASPGSISGVIDFLASPFHDLHHRKFSPDEIEVGRRIGEGSYGVVYEGHIGRGKTKNVTHVILKKAKSNVPGSSEMHNTEVYMNQYLQRNAPEAVADFLGTVVVKPSQVKGRLTEGLWMVWKFQGYHTLDHYMKQKTFPDNLSRQLLGDAAERQRYSSTLQSKTEHNGNLLRIIMAHLLSNLQKIHSTGVVHRDVKPLNLVLAEDSETFKLVDLGACVNLRSGFNYVPKETIMDPVYAPPEQYVMPTSTPRLPPDPICSLISPAIWSLNTPDRFDLFSAGVVMMQLSVKSLRQDNAVKNFARDLKRAGYDLNKWRNTCQVPKEEFALLDADRGAGWELVTALLQPRRDKAFIIWPSLVGSRPSAAAALKHRFFSKTLRRKAQIPDVLPKFKPQAIPVPAFPQLAGAVMGIKVLQDKFVGNMVLTMNKLKSPEFISAITAAAPGAAVSCLALSSSLMLMQWLQTSAQLSHEMSQDIINSIGFSGPASIAFFFLLVKPIVEEWISTARKAQRAKPRTRMQLAKVPSYAEVQRLADEVGDLDSRLGSLEAIARFNSQEPLEDKLYQQVARMRSLLTRPQVVDVS